jgi:hypothetical protein
VLTSHECKASARGILVSYLLASMGLRPGMKTAARR